MKFRNGRISRDRKRSAHEIAEGIALVKAVEQKKQERKTQIIVRVASVASYFLILINLILVIDIYVLKHNVVTSRIIQTNTIHGWYYYTSTLDLNVVTDNGAYWTIDNPRYETVGINVQYTQTPLFKLQYGIKDAQRKATIKRIYDAFTISQYASIIFIILGLVCLTVKRLAGNEYFAGFIIAMMVTQEILLIW